MNKEQGLHVLISSSSGEEQHPPISTVQLAKRIALGGASVIQLREKDTSVSDDALVELGMKLLEVFDRQSRKTTLIINDRVIVAVEIARRRGAKNLGVHVGQSDEPASIVRNRIGSELIMGVSATTIGEAIRAERDGADYIGVGPIFNTVSKTDAVSPIGVEGLQAIRQAVSVPIVVIGGITQDNAADMMQMGANGIAVIGAVLRAKNPRDASRRLAAIAKIA